jgi:protein-tyrosine phosphatase
MIDFHNHVLPNVDDGAKTLDISIKMLKKAFNQGITEVVNTVHFQHPKVEGKNISYDFIKKSKNSLELELRKRNIPIKIHIGAEVFYQPNLLEIKDNPLVNFNKGKYMLIEFNPQIIPENHVDNLFKLKLSGITPIIAHPERYRLVHNNFNIINDWLNLGCLIQVSAGSILGSMGKILKKTASKIISSNSCHILGSDAHNHQNRNFMLKEAFEKVEKMIGSRARKLVLDNPRAIINGKIIKPGEQKVLKKSTFWDRLNRIYR